MKDPAFLFYSSDFLIGCQCLTMEERGQYITLLSLQHQNSVIDLKTCGLIFGYVSVSENEKKLNISDDVLKKFKQDENGNFYNERLKEVIEKRAKFTDSSRENGKKGGRPKKPDENPQVLDGLNLGYEKNNLSENGNENGNINKGVIKKLDIYCDPKIEKCFEIYKEECKDLPSLTFERNDNPTRDKLGDVLLALQNNTDDFKVICQKANKLKKINENKIDFRSILDNYIRIGNGKFETETQDNQEVKNGETGKKYGDGAYTLNPNIT